MMGMVIDGSGMGVVIAGRGWMGVVIYSCETT